MPLTGRAVKQRKPTVEEVREIDIHSFQDKRVFDLGWGMTWTITWSRRGQPTGSVGYRLERDGDGSIAVHFDYRVTLKNMEPRACSYTVRIVTTRCHFGGRRYWFVCPNPLCGRRCRFLYLGGSTSRFECRECQRLSYESRQKHRDKFYELFGKHFDYLHRQTDFKKPRGRKAKRRRDRKLQWALEHADYGLDMI